MKVHFKATIEDFVDVAKRSMKITPLWRVMTIWGLVCGCLMAITLMVFFERWVGLLAGFLIGAMIGVVATWQSRDEGLKKFYLRHYNTKWPVDVEVEISDEGISMKHLDHTSIYYWQFFQTFEETEDALYYRTKFNTVLAVRKRAFESTEQIAEFLFFSQTKMAAVNSLNQFVAGETEIRH